MPSSSKFYYSTDLPKLTGFSLSETLRLEYLDAHPTSACNHLRGRFWLRSEIDEFVALLAEPGMREWISSLLVPSSTEGATRTLTRLPQPSLRA